jgi:hypothetical protein
MARTRNTTDATSDFHGCSPKTQRESNLNIKLKSHGQYINLKEWAYLNILIRTVLDL